MSLGPIFNRKGRKKRRIKDKKETSPSLKISKNLDVNIDNLKNMLQESNDLVIREFIVRGTDH